MTAIVRAKTLNAINRPPRTSSNATPMARIRLVGMPTVASICDVQSVSSDRIVNFDSIVAAVPAMSVSFSAPEMMKITTSAIRPSVNGTFIVRSLNPADQPQYETTRARRLGCYALHVLRRRHRDSRAARRSQAKVFAERFQSAAGSRRIRGILGLQIQCAGVRL